VLSPSLQAVLSVSPIVGSTVGPLVTFAAMTVFVPCPQCHVRFVPEGEAYCEACEPPLLKAVREVVKRERAEGDEATNSR